MERNIMTKPMNKIYGILITIVFSICCFAVTNAQSQEETPIPPESRQLEFWSGDWNIEWKINDIKLGRGKNIAGYILDGRVFQENFDGRPGMNMQGKSWFVFDSRKKLWQQTWVNDQGEFTTFEGRFINGELIMNAVENEIGAALVEYEVRSVYRDIKDDSFIVEVQRRRAGTERWGIVWQFKYKRAN